MARPQDRIHKSLKTLSRLEEGSRRDGYHLEVISFKNQMASYVLHIVKNNNLFLFFYLSLKISNFSVPPCYELNKNFIYCQLMGIYFKNCLKKMKN